VEFIEQRRGSALTKPGESRERRQGHTAWGRDVKGDQGAFDAQGGGGPEGGGL